MNGGKDIKFGDDKRPVSIIPKEQQLLHDFATGEVLVDEFGVPLLAERDAIYTPDATAARSTSVVFGDTDSVYKRKIVETVSPSVPAIYGDYDVSITSSIQGLNINQVKTTGTVAVLPQSGSAINCGTGGSLKIKKQDNTIITDDEWPNLDVRVVEEKITDENGNAIPVSSKKIYFPDNVGISSIFGVSISNSDPQTDKKFLVSGKFLDGNVKIESVAYNSRITLSKPHTAGDKILGESSNIPCSVTGSVVTVTLNDHGFITGDFLHIKTELQSPTFVANATYFIAYKITRTGNNTFQYDLGQNKDGKSGNIKIKITKDTKTAVESFNLEKTKDFGPSRKNRYGSSVFHQRIVSGGFGKGQFASILGDPFNEPDASLLNRGGWKLRRHQDKIDPWKKQNPQLRKRSRVPQYGTGKDVDVIIVDDGFWFGHIEFQSSPTSIKLYDNATPTKTGKPNNYVGGNALKEGFSPSALSATNGICDLLDLVLDGPYYIDPAWFEADAGARLITRWDGTKVPNEAVARAWWSDSAQRSSAFSSVDTVTIPTEYTRLHNNGRHSARPQSSTYHGTPCASQAFGKQYGWAYNANKWTLTAISAVAIVGGSSVNTNVTIEDGFKIQKIFHENKPTNSKYGNKNPTISSNSWSLDFGTDKFGDSGYYYYRQGTAGSGGVQYQSWDMEGNTDGSNNSVITFTDDASANTTRASLGGKFYTLNNLSGNGSGTGADFTAFIAYDGDVTISLIHGGSGYAVGEKITIADSLIGGTGAPDIEITVTSALKVAPRFMTNFTESTIRAEPLSGSPLTAGDALINSGVIFVCSGNNNRQKIVEGGHPDYNNYVGANGAALSASTFTDSGMTFLKTINRPGFPAAIGKSGSGNSTVYNTIIVGALEETHRPEDGKERRASYSAMGGAVDCYAAGDSTLAAQGNGGNVQGTGQLTGYNRYDAYYNYEQTPSGVVNSIESFDAIFDGTSSACPTAAGLIATKLESNRTWTNANVKSWLSNGVGEQSEEDFYFGTEIVGANDTAWGTDLDSLQGGSPTVIWDAPVGISTFPAFKLNQEDYIILNANDVDSPTSPSGEFADTFNTGRKKQLTVTGGLINTDPGISSVRLQNTTEITSGKYVYGKQLGLEFTEFLGGNTQEKEDVTHNDLTLTADSGYFYLDNLHPFHILDNRINDVRITKSELKEIKSDVVLKVAEVFPESSEVSTTLLGVNRAETQLSLFSNVSSYGLESKDWEVVQYRGTITFIEWEERINAIYGERTRGEYREETQESAINLFSFPVSNTFPFGPKFEKNNLYNDETKQGYFNDYLNFIQMGLDFYALYAPSVPSTYTKSWLDKFLDPDLVGIDVSNPLKPDVIYKAGSEKSFASIDNWTETYRDIRASQLRNPVDSSIISFLNVNSILGKSPNTYNATNTRPGYFDNPRRYLLIQSRRVFRYQPGRISGFTFGVRAAREFNTGFKLEWGIFNKTDHYVFQLDAGFLKIVRRSKVKLEDYIIADTGSLTTQEYVKSPDPQDSFESEYNPTGDDYEFWETVIPQDNFNGDSLDGNGPSGHSVKPENITMWKIEFGWYGAIGARFYAYIPAGNGEARWVTLHTLVIENKLGEPCLVDPYFRFRYVVNITKTTDLRTPQFVYKYGASYYIDGGDEGTTTQFSIKTKPDAGQVGVSVGGTSAILGIRPKDQIFNSQGVGVRRVGGDTIKIFNKKIIIPTQLNITTTALTKVRVGVCTACPGWGHVHTIGLRRNGSDNSLDIPAEGLGRQMPIRFDGDNKISPWYPVGGTPIYFTKQDIGAKIIAPSIYNCYIVDVSDANNVSGKAGMDGTEVGFNSYTSARIEGFAGHREFETNDDRKFNGEPAIDRSVSPTEPILLPNNPITDQSNPGYGAYLSQASKLSGTDIVLPDGTTAAAQPVRLSNYDGLAISEYGLSGSEIDIQFTIPRTSREGGLDPTWGYSHWADVLVGVTDVKPYAVDESAEFAISYVISDPDNPGDPLEITPGPGVARTDVLPNSKILFAEHTHAWARSDINGNDSAEAWPIFQYRSRLGLLHSVPKLVGISTGRCGRVKIRVGDPELIGDVSYVTVKPDDSLVTNRYFLTSAQGVLSALTPVGENGYDGGQVAYVTTEGGSVIVDQTSVFTGNLQEYNIDENTKGEYIEITQALSSLSAGDVIKIAIRRVNISTEFSEQNNNKTKLFKFAVFPLYPVIKLKDYGEINNISIKEKIGETQVTIAPKFLVNKCSLNNYGGLADNESTPPTNFVSVDNLSGAEFDNQNKSNIRDFVQKDVFFVGRDQTKTINMDKVFSQDKEVINADESNAEATFIIANEVDPDETKAVIQASVNFKEQ